MAAGRGRGPERLVATRLAGVAPIGPFTAAPAAAAPATYLDGVARRVAFFTALIGSPS